MSENLANIRKINFVLSAIGAAVFAALFLYISLAPKDFDKRTRDFAIARVQDKVDAQLSAAAHSQTADDIVKFAGIFSERLEGNIEAFRASLDAGIATFIADVLASACKLDCERKAQAEEAVKAFFEAVIEQYGYALDRVQNFIVGEYDEVMGELRADLKIFAGTSFAALFFALMLTIFRGRAAAHLLPFSIALTGATLLAAYWYVFGQDWVMAVIFSDYWGWAYPTVLSVIAFFLADIAANKARITTAVFNTIGHIFSSGFHISPC